MTDEEAQTRNPNAAAEPDAGRTPTPHVGRRIEPTTTGPAEAPPPLPQPMPEAPKPAAPVLAAPQAPRVHWAYYVALAAVAAIALYVRLRDPLSTTVIGAEDPYLHMERTYQLAQGHWVRDYPIGFMMILAPFALMGPDVFYNVARFGPAILGTAGVVLMFFLCKPYMHPAGSVTASLVLGLMPEHIRRTDLLFPTAVDLAILPFFFLVVMKLAEGRRWAIPTLLGLTLGLLVIHPWVVALMIPPLLVFGAVELILRREKKAVAASGGVAGVICVASLFTMMRRWQPGTILNDQILPKADAIVNDPTLLFAMPAFVDLPWMIGWPAMLLAVVGVAMAALRHTRFNLLFLFWSLMLLPLVVVDWFGVWYLPHRTVAYLGIGVAVLGGITISEIARALQAAPPKTRIPALVGAIVVLGVVMAPAALSLDTWYRLYDHDEEQAWEALDARDTDFVMAGSWQGRAAYRAMTGRDAVFNPDFFADANTRAVELRQHPDMVVLVDKYTVEAQRDTSFLQGPEWSLVGQWGDVSAYAHQGSAG